jgi:hypothetical protein
MDGPYSQKHISTATTTAVLAKTGTLHRIVVNTTAAGTITLNDTLGTIAVLAASIAPGTYQFDVNCVGKIEVITAGASDLTIVYREG